MAEVEVEDCSLLPEETTGARSSMQNPPAERSWRKNIKRHACLASWRRQGYLSGILLRIGAPRLEKIRKIEKNQKKCGRNCQDYCANIFAYSAKHFLRKSASACSRVPKRRASKLSYWRFAVSRTHLSG